MRIALSPECGSCFDNTECAASIALSDANRFDIRCINNRDEFDQLFEGETGDFGVPKEAILYCPGKNPDGSCQISVDLGGLALDNG